MSTQIIFSEWDGFRFKAKPVTPISCLIRIAEEIVYSAISNEKQKLFAVVLKLVIAISAASSKQMFPVFGGNILLQVSLGQFGRYESRIVQPGRYESRIAQP